MIFSSLVSISIVLLPEYVSIINSEKHSLYDPTFMQNLTGRWKIAESSVTEKLLSFFCKGKQTSACLAKMTTEEFLDRACSTKYYSCCFSVLGIRHEANFEAEAITIIPIDDGMCKKLEHDQQVMRHSAKLSERRYRGSNLASDRQKEKEWDEDDQEWAD
jgi:hypothetical protein